MPEACNSEIFYLRIYVMMCYGSYVDYITIHFWGHKSFEVCIFGKKFTIGFYYFMGLILPQTHYICVFFKLDILNFFLVGLTTFYM